MRLQEVELPDMDPVLTGISISAVQSESTTYDTLEDVFGSVPSSPTARPLDGPSQIHYHPSDIPRLQAEHTTAGYREGITEAKTQSIQAGFDEGFSLGATVGSKAGQLLGILEGIADALRSQGNGPSAEAEQLLREATAELRKESLFNPDYWDRDGIWKYEVNGSSEGEVLFADVANSHPLLRKWTQVVNAEMDRWKLTYDVLGPAEEGHHEATTEKPLAAALSLPSQNPLAW
jgi:hypothetical protein